MAEVPSEVIIWFTPLDLTNSTLDKRNIFLHRRLIGNEAGLRLGLKSQFNQGPRGLVVRVGQPLNHPSVNFFSCPFTFFPL